MNTETRTLDPGADQRDATWKQKRYLRALCQDREVDFDIPPRMTEARASELIDLAKTFARKIPDLRDPGFYVFDGELYRVRERQSGPGVYAELWRVEPGKRTGWKYIPGAVSSLFDKHKVTETEAAEIMRES